MSKKARLLMKDVEAFERGMERHFADVEMGLTFTTDLFWTKDDQERLRHIILRLKKGSPRPTREVSAIILETLRLDLGECVDKSLTGWEKILDWSDEQRQGEKPK